MVRAAGYADLDRIAELYDLARERMHTGGNPTQWTGGYPSRADAARDIDDGNLYVLTDAGGVYAVFAYITAPEPTYSRIYEGVWPNGEPYGTLHRIASDGAHKGVLAEACAYCFSVLPELRIDTHRNNAPMLGALGKNGFQKCGVIYLDRGEDRERLAFRKRAPEK